MNSKAYNAKLVTIIVVSTLILDQLTKLWVKMNMALGDQIQLIGNWAYLFFTENPGMAFGLQFGGEYGKIILSIFRIIVAIIVLLLIIKLLYKEEKNTGVMVALSLIFAGASGNIIDSSFYGVLFDDSLGKVASFLPQGGGYAGFLQGNVVDMFYFPILQTNYPEWIPHLSGKELIIFRSIFNIADLAVGIGFVYLLFLRKQVKEILKR